MSGTNEVEDIDHTAPTVFFRPSWRSPPVNDKGGSPAKTAVFL